MPQRIAILGSTGSIGAQTLDVVREFRDEFDVVALAAGRNSELLAKQVREFQPDYFDCLAVSGASLEGAARLDAVEMARLDDVDFVLHAMSGTVGIHAAAAGLEAGKTVGLANKESVVMAGRPLMKLASDNGGRIVPIDSEPNAIWQCTLGEVSKPTRYYLTASGGALRDRTWSDLSDVTPTEALHHPNWNMGAKITIDCATMMNKAFEVIETAALFNVDMADIEVVMHRESVVHAMVKLADGSIKAHLGPPDMRHPIQFALFHPDRRAESQSLDFDPTRMGQLSFEPVVPGRFPCFDLAMQYAKIGGTYHAALAGADDAAVALFLEGAIGYTDILDVVREVMERHENQELAGIDQAIAVASWAAAEATSIASEGR